VHFPGRGDPQRGGHEKRSAVGMECGWSSVAVVTPNTLVVNGLTDTSRVRSDREGLHDLSESDIHDGEHFVAAAKLNSQRKSARHIRIKE